MTKSQHLNLGDIKVTKSQHLNLGDIPPLDENGSIISDLVASGVDINAYYSTLDDKQHKLYVNRAIANNASIFFLNFLESKGMNIHAHPSSKYCLQDAIQNGNLETLKWLIERGIGPSLIILDKQQLPNSFGLHLAVTLKQYEIVNCLLMHRCQELNQKNAKGKTAMDIAIALKDEKLINMLKNAIDIDHRIRAFNTIVLEPLEKFLKNKGNSIKSMKCCYVENCPKIVIEITLQTTEKLTAALKELDMDYALNPYQDPLTPKKLKRKINTVYFDLFPHSTDYSDVLKVLKKHFQPAKRQSYKPQDPSFYTPPVPTASTSTKDTQTPKKDTPKSTSDTQSSKDSKSFTSFKLPPQQPDAYYLQIIAEKQKQERDFLESENPQNRQSGVGKSKSRRASDLKNDQCSFPNPLILNRAKPDFIEEKEEETMISSNEKKPSKKLLPSSIKKAPLPKRAPVNDSTPSSQITPRRRKKRHAPPPLTIRSMLSAPVERKLTTLTAAKTNFETYFQSALNSHIGIGDLITRIDSKENYDIERSLFDRKLVKYALEYRLLRFTQALLATGNQMTAIDRGIFDTNVCQAFNLDQLTSIRNQVRHAECLNLNELIKLCEELSLESVKHSLEVLTLGKQEALDTLIPLQLKQTLTTLEWDIHFSGEKDEKEKEYEGDQSDNAKKYLREQFHFLESAFKPFKEDFYRFTKEGDRKDAMKMCILKMAACVSYLQPSRSTKAISQEITLKGNILAHEVQDIIPYCDMDEISDGKLYKFIKRLDLNKESFALST